MGETAGQSSYTDFDESARWVLNEWGYTLYDLGRNDEARAGIHQHGTAERATTIRNNFGSGKFQCFLSGIMRQFTQGTVFRLQLQGHLLPMAQALIFNAQLFILTEDIHHIVHPCAQTLDRIERARQKIKDGSCPLHDRGADFLACIGRLVADDHQSNRGKQHHDQGNFTNRWPGADNGAMAFGRYKLLAFHDKPFRNFLAILAYFYGDCIPKPLIFRLSVNPA